MFTVQKGQTITLEVQGNDSLPVTNVFASGFSASTIAVTVNPANANQLIVSGTNVGSTAITFNGRNSNNQNLTLPDTIEVTPPPAATSLVVTQVA